MPQIKAKVARFRSLMCRLRCCSHFPPIEQSQRTYDASVSSNPICTKNYIWRSFLPYTLPVSKLIVTFDSRPLFHKPSPAPCIFCCFSNECSCASERLQLIASAAATSDQTITEVTLPSRMAQGRNKI